MKTSERVRKSVTLARPTLQELEHELHHRALRKVFRRGLAALVVVSALLTLMSALWLPVLRVRGANMEPNLWAGDMVLVRRGTGRVRAGDIVAFYHNNSLLLRRVIGLPGDTVEIDETGQVRVNGATLDEPYVTVATLGNCEVEFPQEVPAQCYFVLGDNRVEAADSRGAAVGMVPQENVTGKILFRI